MQKTMQRDAAVFRASETMSQGLNEMVDLAGKISDLNVTDRSLVWNST